MRGTKGSGSTLGKLWYELVDGQYHGNGIVCAYKVLYLGYYITIFVFGIGDSHDQEDGQGVVTEGGGVYWGQDAFWILGQLYKLDLHHDDMYPKWGGGCIIHGTTRWYKEACVVNVVK